MSDDTTEVIHNEGHDALWGWFGLSYASFLALPRVLLCEMPDEWQGKLAALLTEMDATFPNAPDVGIRCQAVKDGKMTKFPPWMLQYRHPDRAAIEACRRHDGDAP